MLKLEDTLIVPPDLVENLTDYSQYEMRKWHNFFEAVAQTTVRAVLARDEAERPLFMIGAMRRSFLSSERELWMFVSRFMRASHALEGRPIIQEWFSTQRGPIFAHTDNRRNARFCEFFGMQLKGENLGMQVYEVPECLLLPS